MHGGCPEGVLMKDAILPTLMQVGRGGRAGGSVAVCSLGSSRPFPPPPPSSSRPHHLPLLGSLPVQPSFLRPPTILSPHLFMPGSRPAPMLSTRTLSTPRPNSMRSQTLERTLVVHAGPAPPLSKLAPCPRSPRLVHAAILWLALLLESAMKTFPSARLHPSVKLAH